jgi:hypothetical protein
MKPRYIKFLLKKGDIVLFDEPEPESMETPLMFYRFQLCFNEPEASIVGEDLFATLYGMFATVNNLIAVFWEISGLLRIHDVRPMKRSLRTNSPGKNNRFLFSLAQTNAIY